MLATTQPTDATPVERIVVWCFGCGARLGVRADSPKTQVECPKCGGAVQVLVGGDHPDDPCGTGSPGQHPEQGLETTGATTTARKPARPAPGTLAAQQDEEALRADAGAAAVGWTILLTLLVPFLSMIVVRPTVGTILISGLLAVCSTIPVSYSLARRNKAVRAIGLATACLFQFVLCLLDFCLSVLQFLA